MVYTLTEANKLNYEDLIEISRYALPILAVIVLGLCLAALLRRRPQYLGEVQIINTATGDSFPLTSRETSLGRHKNCDIILNYPTVSRQHAVIICGKDGWYIKGINNSDSKVFINGKPIEKRQMIKTGDKIRLGEVTLIFDNRID
jgi:cell division protein FtsW